MIQSLKVARKIRTLRSKTGTTQIELSNMSGVSRRTIQRIEAMENNPDGPYIPGVNTVQKVSSALGIPFWTFLSTSPKKLSRLIA